MDLDPPVLAELAAKLKAAGWTVRKLRARGVGGRTAAALIRGESVSIASAEDAAALVGMTLALKRKR